MYFGHGAMSERYAISIIASSESFPSFSLGCFAGTKSYTSYGVNGLYIERGPRAAYSCKGYLDKRENEAKRNEKRNERKGFERNMRKEQKRIDPVYATAMPNLSLRKPIQSYHYRFPNDAEECECVRVCVCARV